MKTRTKGELTIGDRCPTHRVEIQMKAGEGDVIIEVLRESRRDAKGDLRIVVSASAARDLMRALQGRADEADRLAYQAWHHADLTHHEAIAAVVDDMKVPS